MNRFFKFGLGLLLVGLVMALAWTQVFSQTLVPTTIAWTAPQTGSPSVRYVVQYSQDGGDWTDAGTSTITSFSLDLETGSFYRFRVAGVDSQDRQGYFSAPGPEFSPVVPSEMEAPGQPVFVDGP